MATNSGHGEAVLDPAPIWWVGPEQSDWLAWTAIIALALAAFGVMTLYAKFDKWAEHKAEGTPLAKTIPTLLTIALLYEIFPLDHFHVLLPLSAILLAVMADWMHAQSVWSGHGNIDEDTEPAPTVGKNEKISAEEVSNV